MRAHHLENTAHDWFVFQPQNTEGASVHATKRLAVREAQYCGCTENRPKRIMAGHYELFGCGGHQYYIMSKALMEANFPTLMNEAYENT